MGKLIMWNMVTLDGYFEGPKPWEIDWHVWGEELEELSREQLRSASALLFGRLTYLGMADYWTKATGETAELMNRVPKVVASRRLTDPTWQNTRIVGDIEKEIVGLKRESKKDIFIFGSASLCSSLMKNNLIDEYRLGLNPIVLGGGNPLFKPLPAGLKMELIEARPLKMGCVIYATGRQGSATGPPPLDPGLTPLDQVYSA